MNLRNVSYWIATGLVALPLLGGGIADLSHSEEVVRGLAELGYPHYLSMLLGAWKVLGAITIVAPRMPRLKEWAYAGILFDLSGAAFSHASVGDPAWKVAAPLVILAFGMASCFLRPASRRLTGNAEASAPAPAPAFAPLNG